MYHVQYQHPNFRSFSKHLKRGNATRAHPSLSENNLVLVISLKCDIYTVCGVWCCRAVDPDTNTLYCTPPPAPPLLHRLLRCTQLADGRAGLVGRFSVANIRRTFSFNKITLHRGPCGGPVLRLHRAMARPWLVMGLWLVVDTRRRTAVGSETFQTTLLSATAMKS